MGNLVFQGGNLGTSLCEFRVVGVVLFEFRQLRLRLCQDGFQLFESEVCDLAHPRLESLLTHSELLVNGFEGFLLLSVEFIDIALILVIFEFLVSVSVLDIFSVLVKLIELLALVFVLLRDLGALRLVCGVFVKQVFEQFAVLLRLVIVRHILVHFQHRKLVCRQVCLRNRRTVENQPFLLVVGVGVLPFEFLCIGKFRDPIRLALFVLLDKATVIEVNLTGLLLVTIFQSVDFSLFNLELRLCYGTGYSVGVFANLASTVCCCDSLRILLFSCFLSFAHGVCVNLLLGEGYVSAYLLRLFGFELRFGHSVKHSLLLLFVVLPIGLILDNLGRLTGSNFSLDSLVPPCVGSGERLCLLVQFSQVLQLLVGHIFERGDKTGVVVFVHHLLLLGNHLLPILNFLFEERLL